MTGTIIVNAIIPVNFVRILFTVIPPTWISISRLMQTLAELYKKILAYLHRQGSTILI